MIGTVWTGWLNGNFVTWQRGSRDHLLCLGRSRAKSSVRTEVTAERRRTGEANLGEDGSNIDDSGPDRLGGACLGAPVKSVADAIAALMDTPHPLDILGEPGSYGFTVPSRTNYTCSVTCCAN